jgi:hypothetical protein
MEDIFEQGTLDALKNATVYRVSHSSNLLMGQCHTVCNLQEWSKKSGIQLFLKTDHNVNVFFHHAGADFMSLHFGRKVLEQF